VTTIAWASEEERRLLFTEAAARLHLSAVAVEKDFWVCWILAHVYAESPWKDVLTFKGGTSLSKCFQVIERFSEDIDLVVDRSFLGTGDGEFLDGTKSVRSRERWLKALVERSKLVLREEFYPMLRQRIGADLAEGDWSLEWMQDGNSPEGSVLAFHYPRAVPIVGSIPPRIKLELIARADAEPVLSHSVSAYVYDAFPGVFIREEVPVRVVSPVRTLWEKVLLLHEEFHRPEDKQRTKGVSRHLYDVWSLMRTGEWRKEALNARFTLLPEIVAHRSVFFRTSWGRFETMVPGGIRALPPAHQVAYWRSDFNEMKREMVFGFCPDFDEMLTEIELFQREINAV